MKQKKNLLAEIKKLVPVPRSPIDVDESVLKKNVS